MFINLVFPISCRIPSLSTVFWPQILIEVTLVYINFQLKVNLKLFITIINSTVFCRSTLSNLEALELYFISNM